MLRDVAEAVGIVLVILLGLVIASALIVVLVEIVKGIGSAVTSKRRETMIMRRKGRD